MLESLFPLIRYYDIYGILSTSTLVFILLYIQIIEQKCNGNTGGGFMEEISLGKKFLLKGKFQQAQDHFDNAVELAPNEPSTYFSRATCYLAIKKSDQALKDFNKVLELKPDSMDAKLYRGDIYLKMGDYDKAHIDFENVIRSGQDTGKAQEKLVVIHELAREYDHAMWLLDANNDCVSAQPLLAALVNASPLNIKMRELKAKCHMAMRQNTQAVQEYRAIANLRPDDTTYTYKASQSLFEMGDLENALNEIRHCLKIDPESKLCFPLYRRLKKLNAQFTKIDSHITNSNYKQCLTELRQLRESLQETDESRKVLLNLYPRIMQKECVCMAKNGHPKAMFKCNEAIDKDPNDIEALLARANLHLDNEEDQEAKADFEAVHKIDPSESRAEDGLNQIKNKEKRKELKDYYGILGVKKSASKSEINRAYRKLARKWHPDMNKDKPKVAEKKFQDITEAKEVLTNPEKRKLYDSGVDPNKPEAQQSQHAGQTFFFYNAPNDFFNSFEGFQGGFQFHFG